MEVMDLMLDEFVDILAMPQSRTGVCIEAAHPDGAGLGRGAGPGEGLATIGGDVEVESQHKVPHPLLHPTTSAPALSRLPTTGIHHLYL
ncbi:unnamed protein product [Urochloa humidicola]